MTPEMIVLIVQVLIKYGPDAAAAIQKLFQTAAPTQADWDELFSKVKSFEDYQHG